MAEKDDNQLLFAAFCLVLINRLDLSSCVLVTKDMSLKPTSVPGLLPVFTFEGWVGKEEAFPRNFWQYSRGSNSLVLHLNDILGVPGASPGASPGQKETSRIV